VDLIQKALDPVALEELAGPRPVTWSASPGSHMGTFPAVAWTPCSGSSDAVERSGLVLELLDARSLLPGSTASRRAGDPWAGLPARL